MIKSSAVLGAGIVGAGIAALCCFTPVLVLSLGAIGLSAWIGGLDYVLMPALAVFLAIAMYGFYLRRRDAESGSSAPPMEKG